MLDHEGNAIEKEGRHSCVVCAVVVLEKMEFIAFVGTQ